MSRNSADLHQKKILECTWGIAFLGTPHLGSDLAAWAEPLAKLVGVVKSTNSDILEALKVGSYTLERIEGDFQKMIRGRRGEKKREMRIASFYEELPYGKLDLVSIAPFAFSTRGYINIAKTISKGLVQYMPGDPGSPATCYRVVENISSEAHIVRCGRLTNSAMLTLLLLDRPPPLRKA